MRTYKKLKIMSNSNFTKYVLQKTSFTASSFLESLIQGVLKMQEGFLLKDLSTYIITILAKIFLSDFHITSGIRSDQEQQ